MSGFILYVIDTETTGLNAEEHDVIEISASRLGLNDSNQYTELEQKTWLLKAINPKTISDEALSKNGHKREDILGISKYGKENYLPAQEVVSDIEMWMMDDNVSAMDRIFVGQNPAFDVGMLQALWKKVGREKDFPFEIGNGNRILDTKQIVALFDICTGRRRKAYSLGQLIKACGVKKDKAHRADGDVRMTRDLLLFLVDMIKQPVVEKFNTCYLEEE